MIYEDVLNYISLIYKLVKKKIRKEWNFLIIKGNSVL